MMSKVWNFDAVNKFLPAILLIISVLLFRHKFNSKQSQKIFAREKIIAIHLGIFISFIIVYAPYLALTNGFVLVPKIPDSDPPLESMQSCRLLVSYWYFYFFATTINIASLVLFIYMSVMFSRPLTGYWKEFLLSYRSQSLSQAILGKKVNIEQNKAKHYH